MTKKQKIIRLLHEKKRITLDDAVDEIGYGIYYNARKYVGEYLSQMVKDGLIVRVKRGVFEAAPPKEKLLI